MKEILINRENDTKQILLLEDGELKEKYIESDKIVRIEGNMYVGQVKDVLQGMQAAFINIGLKKNTFIHLKDILPKVDVAKERILDINPDVKVNAYKTFYTPQTSGEFDFTQYDYVIDAIDTVVGKIELVMQANEAKTPIICSMGAGNKMNPADFEVADIYKTSVCPLAKVMRKELKNKSSGFSSDATFLNSSVL